jgi:hypothetical protein
MWLTTHSTIFTLMQTLHIISYHEHSNKHFATYEYKTNSLSIEKEQTHKHKTDLT